VQAPVLELSQVEAGKYELSWASTQATDPYADFLEEAVEPEFVTAEVIYQGASDQYTIYGRAAGDYYYRVRRQVGSISSDYSNGVALRIGSASDWQVTPAALYSDQTLLAVHSALLRMCAARGDMFAVLALPQHYRESEAAAHAAELKTSLLGSEQIGYGFGGLYHPWLIGREENDLLNLRTNPPDGAMTGIMALRSWQRGPWISPANEPLHGIVDMTPAISRASRQMLQDSLINLVRQEPGGFLCLCELTLSDDPDYSPINVRRLISFLRKTALRAGAAYVFEPNGDEFRRAVQRGFETLLDSLLLLGAFAGRTSREAFQVVTDSSLNTPQAMARGEFIVELRFAPSLPMRFLTVRLLQTADRTFVTEGGA
jgi:phage tail sheath protein FI